MAYAVVLSVESVYLHRWFATGFDTAIFDQVLWLLSNGDEPFSTIVGRPMLANLQFGLALLTPLYWLGFGASSLLVAQSVGLAATAPALYALARDRGAPGALAAIPALLWLVSPWTASVNLFEFHPQVFAPVLLTLSVITALRRRWVLFGACAVMAMSLKQDISLIYLALGAVLAMNGLRRSGVIVALGSSVWIVLARTAFEERDNSYAFYERRFAGERGETLGDAFAWMLHNPINSMVDMLGQSGPATAFLLLAAAGLALFAPSWLLLAAPPLLYNALSAYWPQHTISHQYHLMTAAGVFIAAAVGVHRLPAAGRPLRLAIVGVGFVALTTSVAGGALVHGSARSQSIDAGERADIRGALAVIPANVPVAATPRVQPHLSHRRELYTLPEPFVAIGWNSPVAMAKVAARVDNVRYAVFAGAGPREYGPAVETILPRLRRLGFVLIYSEGWVHVFERRN